MAGSINGLRYAKLLLSGGITSSELDTELADAGNLGSMHLLLGMNYYKNRLLSYGSAPYNILFGSALAKYNFILTTMYFMGTHSSDYIRTIDVQSETVGTKAANGSGDMAGATLDLAASSIWNAALISSTTKALYQYEYLTDTNNTHGSQLSEKHLSSGAFTASVENYGGYIAGFYSGPTFTTAMSKLDFSTQTSSSVASMVSSNRTYFGCAESSTDAYTMGGSTTHEVAASTATINKITKDTNTRSTLADSLDSVKSSGASNSSDDNGYNIGGKNAGGTEQTTIDKLAFDTDATSVIAAALATASYIGGAARGNGDIFYAAYNQSSAHPTTVYKLDYTTETISTSVAAFNDATGSSYISPTVTAGGA